MPRVVLLVMLVLFFMVPGLVQAALVERLMGLADDGVTPGPNISVHKFFAANHQRIEGKLTRDQVIAILGITGAEVTEYDALAALAPTGTTAIDIARKAMYLDGVHSIFLLAEVRAPGYNTPALVRSKLGLP